jgi:hypothetical protein
MEKFEKSLYKIRYHKRKQQKAFPTWAAAFIVLCIWSIILRYTICKSLAYCVARMQEKSCL